MNNNISEAADRIIDLINEGQVTRLALMIIIAEAIGVENGEKVA